MKKQETPKTLGQEIVSYIITIAIAIGASLLFINFIATLAVVDGESMETTLQDQDRLVLWRLGYKFNDPERFDIVVFQPYENDPNTRYIKRVIGLPGDTVQVIEGEFYVNGQLLKDDTFGAELMLDGGLLEDPVTLKTDQYILIGDNRNHSKDSRVSDVGIVDIHQILGEAVFRLWPLKSFGTIK